MKYECQLTHRPATEKFLSKVIIMYCNGNGSETKYLEKANSPRIYDKIKVSQGQKAFSRNNIVKEKKIAGSILVR